MRNVRVTGRASVACVMTYIYILGLVCDPLLIAKRSTREVPTIDLQLGRPVLHGVFTVRVKVAHAVGVDRQNGEDYTGLLMISRRAHLPHLRILCVAWTTAAAPVAKYTQKTTAWLTSHNIAPFHLVWNLLYMFITLRKVHIFCVGNRAKHTRDYLTISKPLYRSPMCKAVLTRPSMPFPSEYNEECSCNWTCECRVCDEFRGMLQKQGWTDH